MRRAGWVSLAILSASALGLRCWGVTRQGMLFWDEGLFLLGARFLQTRLPELAGLGCGPVQGFPVLLEKPLHVILVALSGAGGLSPTTGNRLSALAGTLTVLLVLRIARRAGSPAAGWASAAWLAVSSYHLLYSRTGLHEIDAAFLGAAAVALVLRDAGGVPGTGRRFLAGLLFGLALCVAALQGRTNREVATVLVLLDDDCELVVLHTCIIASSRQ